MFGFKPKEKPKRWRLFVANVRSFTMNGALAQHIIQKANEVGLQGKRITVILRESSPRNTEDEIWFEGEME